MADDDQDPEQKTEQPSSKRLEDAIKRGNVPVSKEVNNFMTMVVIALTIMAFAPSMFKDTNNLLTPFLSQTETIPTDRDGLGKVLSKVIFSGFAIITAPLISSIVAAFAASLMQNGFMITTEPLAPQLSRINPLAGLKRMFSVRSVVEFLKSLIKIGIVGYVAFAAVYPELPHIRQLPNSSTEALLMFLTQLATRMIMGVAVAMFFIALVDIIYQRFQYIKSLRMTRQEIRDEYKQNEGDPVIKQRLRRMRQERARRRMMTAIPKADVVITNPTHFAVALQYDGSKMKAPTVIAKGQDDIALKIRELALQHKVPVVENAPLARALYSSTEIDEEIPLAQYEAVAKIISYVYQLKGKKR